MQGRIFEQMWDWLTSADPAAPPVPYQAAASP
jgi:hypothetical protein